MSGNKRHRDSGKETGLLIPREQFDSCLIGWVEKFGASKPVYSYSSVIDAMSENYGSTEAARDMFSHSVRNAGQNSPCYLFQGG